MVLGPVVKRLPQAFIPDAQDDDIELIPEHPNPAEPHPNRLPTAMRKIRKMWRSCFKCQTLFTENRFAREGVEVTHKLHEEDPLASVALGSCDACLEEILCEHGLPTTSSAEDRMSMLVAQFDTDQDGALNATEFEALVDSLLGGRTEFGSAADVAKQISTWTGFEGATLLTPELLWKASCDSTPFGPLQSALFQRLHGQEADAYAQFGSQHFKSMLLQNE
jgi:hypothetical protein